MNYYPYPNIPVIPGAPQMPCSPDLEFVFQLAHAYVPWQNMTQVFSPAEALSQGTLFPELVMPYKG
jgi:hypothetical protein